MMGSRLGVRTRADALGRRGPGAGAQREAGGNQGRSNRTDERLEHPVPGVKGACNVIRNRVSGNGNATWQTYILWLYRILPQ